MEVEHICRLLKTMTARVQYSLWEGNALADFLTNLVFPFAGDFLISQYQDIPSEGKRIYNLDRQGAP